MHLTDIREPFIPNKQNTHSFQMHMEHFQRQTTGESLNKFKKIEIVSSIFSDHKGLKLETNIKENNPQNSKTWRLNGMLLNNEWVKIRLRKKSKSFWKQTKMNSQQPKTYGTQQRQS